MFPFTRNPFRARRHGRCGTAIAARQDAPPAWQPGDDLALRQPLSRPHRRGARRAAGLFRRDAGDPQRLPLVIDRGFMGGGDISRWFEYLFLIVAILALATAARFYFVSWLGERVVADIRRSEEHTSELQYIMRISYA